MNKLIDPQGRHIHKLRISLLDACNMRCLYCMPEKREFVPTKDCLSAIEIKNISSDLVDLGIDEIRLTGGEPLLRSDIREIIEGLSDLKLNKLGLTTNAIKLKKNLAWLSKTNCKSLNISLDSLNAKKFFDITKTNLFESVLESILMAKEMGFHVKLNTVLMKGVNDDEILDFLEFSAKHDIEVRFLELMKIGVVLPVFDSLFISADEATNIIKEKWKLKSLTVPIDSTSFNFLGESDIGMAKFGFIASESKPFCNGCSRLRLGPEGQLRPCLMTNHGPSLKGLDKDGIHTVLKEIMPLKPTDRVKELDQPMYQIGG